MYACLYVRAQLRVDIPYADLHYAVYAVHNVNAYACEQCLVSNFSPFLSCPTQDPWQSSKLSLVCEGVGKESVVVCVCVSVCVCEAGGAWLSG